MTETDNAKAKNKKLDDAGTIHSLSKTRVETEKDELKKATRFNISSNEVFNFLEQNEDGDAALFVELHRGKLVYDASACEWFVWAGHHWKLDLIEEALDGIRAVIDVYLDEAKRQAWRQDSKLKKGKTEAAANHGEIRNRLLKRVNLLQSEKRKKSVLHLARVGKGSLAISGQQWDSDPMLLGCDNGVIEQKTGKHRAGRPEDYIKTACPTKWEGLNKNCPTWEKFIGEIFVKEETFKTDTELVNYFWKLLGFGITGLSTEHIFPFLWGMGRNGKTTLIELVKFVMGDLAHKTESELLLQQKHPRQPGTPNPTLLALRGKRIVWAAETDDGRKLNVGRLKELSGGETLTARQLYTKTKTDFETTHLLLLLTNFKPIAPAGDYALWKRIHLIPFQLSFVDDPQKPFERQAEKNLLKKLKGEAPGILAWFVRGCLKWQKEGLKPPGAVLSATKEYQADEDILKHFEEDCCLKNAQYEESSSNLYTRYKAWCPDMGHYPMSSTKFGREMKKRHKFEKRGCVYYQGLALKTQ
jgi:putative DNA primase/helicase